MKYELIIYYSTGDSNGSHDEESQLEGTWENPEIIKLNIERIKEHYKWYKAENENFGAKVKEPEWHVGMSEFSVELLLDDNTKYKQSAFWCGYFERLYGIKAVVAKTDKLEFFF